MLLGDIVSRAIKHFTSEDGDLQAVFPRRPETQIVEVLGARDSGRPNARTGLPILQSITLDSVAHLSVQQLCFMPINMNSPEDKPFVKMMNTKNLFWHSADGYRTFVLNIGQCECEHIEWKGSQPHLLAPLSNDVTVRIPFLGHDNTHGCSAARFWSGLTTPNVDEMVEPGHSSSFDDFVTTEEFRNRALCGPTCPPSRSSPLPVADSSNSVTQLHSPQVAHFQYFDAGVPSGQMVGPLTPT